MLQFGFGKIRIKIQKRDSSPVWTHLPVAILSGRIFRQTPCVRRPHLRRIFCQTPCVRHPRLCHPIRALCRARLRWIFLRFHGQSSRLGQRTTEKIKTAKHELAPHLHLHCSATALFFVDRLCLCFLSTASALFWRRGAEAGLVCWLFHVAAERCPRYLDLRGSLSDTVFLLILTQVTIVWRCACKQKLCRT